MTYRKIFFMIAVLAACVPSFAQSTTAEAYFNQASKEYVKQDKTQALRTLDLALQQYPADPRLLKLAEELVKEEQPQQQKEQQKKEEQDQKEQEQEKKDQEQAQEQEKKEEDQQKQEQAKQGQEQQQQNAQQGGKGEPRAGMIAPQDAIRMLDALERSEKEVQEKVRSKLRPAARRSIQKDW